jgi:CheY-like chemotaxis protein
MSRLKALLIDDEEQLLETLREELQHANWQVEVAHDAPEGLKKLSAQSFEVIVTDIYLPGQSGLQILRNIRDHSLDTILVLMSGYATMSSWETYDLGAQAFLGKPFPAQKLVAVVNRLRTPMLERWQDKENKRSQWKISGHLEVDAKTGEGHCSLGRGGIFLSCPIGHLAKGNIASFRVNMPSFTLEGIGEIMWTREHAQDQMLPGLGLEFLYLEEPCRGIIAKAIAQSLEKAFIPKGSICKLT